MQFDVVDKDTIRGETGLDLAIYLDDALRGRPVRLVRSGRVDGDLSLEQFDDPVFDGTWVFSGDLHVGGAFTFDEFDVATAVFVTGALHATRFRLSGASVHVLGDLAVQNLVLTTYNHGSLRVHGKTRCPLVVSLDHHTELVGGLSGIWLDGEADAVDALLPHFINAARVDRERLWNGHKGKLLSDEAKDPPVRRSPGTDAYGLAEQLVARWLGEGSVLFSSNWDRDEFVEALGKALLHASKHRSPASALGEWLLERDEVEDVLASDEVLFRG